MLNVDRFIADCRAALSESSPVPAIKETLERTVADASEVEAALGTPREGKIGSIYHGPDLTILNVVWAPGMTVYPHDHRMWALIGLYGGREDNTFYRRGGRGLEVAGGRQLDPSDTTLLGPSIIHAVTNPLRVFTGAIHIYGGDFFGMPRSEWDPETLHERPWDAARTRKAFAEANERWRAECVRGGAS
jgi:predicted metal-dependent enzyme (double-stranded beta helix superfamily)